MNEDATQRGDPYRVDPAGHRGHDTGILERRFELPRDRRDDDPRGPRPLNRAEPATPGVARFTNRESCRDGIGGSDAADGEPGRPER